MALSQNETTLLISGGLLVIAAIINLVSARILQRTGKWKEKIHHELEETIQLRNVILDEKLEARERHVTNNSSP
jgi:hypothetical protein